MYNIICACLLLVIHSRTVKTMMYFNSDEDGVLSNIHPVLLTGTYFSPWHSFDDSDDSSVASPSPFFSGSKTVSRTTNSS